MPRPTCVTCAYFNPNNLPYDGQCRRKPPVVAIWNDSPCYLWPVVLPKDWCGSGSWDNGTAKTEGEE